MTYKLCFLYFNVTGSISIPAPLKYSNDLARLCTELDDRIIIPH